MWTWSSDRPSVKRSAFCKGLLFLIQSEATIMPELSFQGVGDVSLDLEQRGVKFSDMLSTARSRPGGKTR
jgi:hypothetical protein